MFETVSYFAVQNISCENSRLQFLEKFWLHPNNDLIVIIEFYKTNFVIVFEFEEALSDIFGKNSKISNAG